jgi:hypothetical protein
MAEASIYEIHAQGRNSLTFLDAYKAGEAFYNLRREDMPKVERFDPAASGGERIGIYAAMTGKSPNGYEHIFLDADEKFRAGYEAARERQPDKAVSILDAQQPAQQTQQGQSMPAKQVPSADKSPAPPLTIDGNDVKRLTIEKIKAPSGTEYKVTAFGAGKLPLAEYEAMPREKLAHRLGQHIADAAQALKGRKRTLTPRDLPAPAWQSMKFFKHAVRDQTTTGELARQAAGMPELPAIQPAAAEPPQQPVREVPPREAEAAPAPAVGKTPAQQAVQQAAANTIELVVERQPEQQPDRPKEPTREQLRTSLEQRFEVASIGTLLKPADEYRFKGDGPLRIAFTDHGKQMSTTLDTREVVKGMADLAQAKGWREINANGTPEFKRQMWMEGNLRGIHVAGYSPSKEDHERLKAARAELAQPAKAPDQPRNTVEALQPRQPEKRQEPQKQAVQQPAQAQGSSRAQYLMAARTVLTEQGLDAQTIERAVEGLGRKIDTMVAAGQTLPKLHVFDGKAPSLKPVPTVTVQPTMQPGREVAAPGR